MMRRQLVEVAVEDSGATAILARPAARELLSSRLLLRHTVQRAKSPNQIT
jgi:hypothetical protein